MGPGTSGGEFEPEALQTIDAWSVSYPGEEVDFWIMHDIYEDLYWGQWAERSTHRPEYMQFEKRPKRSDVEDAYFRWIGRIYPDVAEW